MTLEIRSHCIRLGCADNSGMRSILRVSFLVPSTALVSCPPASPGPAGDLWMLPEETSGTGLCCWQSTSDPRTPILQYIPPLSGGDLGPTGCAKGAHPVREGLCEQLCCQTPGGSRFFTAWGSCLARGGWMSGDCPLPDSICCQMGDSYRIESPQDCKAGMQQDVLDCDEICCQSMGQADWLAAGRCAQMGTWVEPRACARDGATGN